MIDKTKVSFVPPVKPKGGEVYIYSHGGDRNKKDDWKCNQQRWHYNTRNPLPRKDPIYFKYFFHIMTPDGPSKEFSKHVIVPAEDDTYIMLHYLGDENLSKDFPHGNSTLRERTYTRTAPSVLSNIKHAHDKEPSTVYKTMQTESSVPNVLQRVLKPRDMKQIRNTQHNVRQQLRISKDTLYNLHELAYHLNGFIWKIETFPDLLVVIGLKNIVDEFSKVIDVKLENISIKQYFSYDTTFEIGDFFLTPFIFRHVLFEGSPLMPLAYMLHERRQQNAHAVFVRLLKEKCPAISRAKFPIILDREKVMTNAFQRELPNLGILYCWNHFRRDVKLWLRKHCASSAEMPYYMDGISSLLSSQTLEEYDDRKQQITENWSRAMVEYFDCHLKKDITQHCARFVIEKFGLYNPFSGITNNTSESENAVIKRLVQWKEVTIDTAVLALHMDQQYLYNESLRGRCGIGQFVLREMFSAAKLEEDEVSFCPISCKIEDIVDFVHCETYVEVAEDRMVDENVENIAPEYQKVPERKSQTAMAIETEQNLRQF